MISNLKDAATAFAFMVVFAVGFSVFLDWGIAKSPDGPAPLLAEWRAWSSVAIAVAAVCGIIALVLFGVDWLISGLRRAHRRLVASAVEAAKRETQDSLRKSERRREKNRAQLLEDYKGGYRISRT